MGVSVRRRLVCRAREVVGWIEVGTSFGYTEESWHDGYKHAPLTQKGSTGSFAVETSTLQEMLVPNTCDNCQYDFMVSSNSAVYAVDIHSVTCGRSSSVTDVVGQSSIPQNSGNS